MNKFVLGTAQFGMHYGINNKRGQIDKKEAFQILDRAVESGIDTVDTAYDYGESEKVLGDYLSFRQNTIKIISKLPQCEYKKVEEIFEHSLNKLGISNLYGYLIHNFQNYKKEQGIWEELERLRNNGRVKKIGFSLYHPYELEYILENNLEIDIIQIPLNVFDQRFLSYFNKLKNKGTQVYIRSVFLQGLVFKNPEELDSRFIKIREKIEQLNVLSAESHIPIAALCINFAVLNELVDKIVIGVDSIGNLNENMLSSDYAIKVKNIMPRLFELNANDEKVILPCNWGLISS